MKKGRVLAHKDTKYVIKWLLEKVEKTRNSTFSWSSTFMCGVSKEITSKLFLFAVKRSQQRWRKTTTKNKTLSRGFESGNLVCVYVVYIYFLKDQNMSYQMESDSTNTVYYFGGKYDILSATFRKMCPIGFALYSGKFARMMQWERISGWWIILLWNSLPKLIFIFLSYWEFQQVLCRDSISEFVSYCFSCHWI